MLVAWLNRGLEALWLLTVVSVPLIFFDRDYLLSELELSYADVPKTALLRSLVGLMAVLWLIEWGIQGRPASPPLFTRHNQQLRLEKLLAGLMYWLSQQPTRWLTLAVILYLGSTLLSTVLSASFSVSMWGLVPGQDTYPAYTITTYVVLFSVIGTHLKTKVQLGRLIAAIVVMGVLTGGYSVSQHYGYDIFDLLEIRGRSGSTVGNPIVAGALLLMTISISLMAATAALHGSKRTRGFWIETGLWSLVLAVQLMGLTFTFSRGPWIATTSTLAAFLALVMLFAGWRTAVRAAVTLGLAATLAGGIILVIPEPFIHGDTGEMTTRFSTTLDFSESEVPRVIGTLASVGGDVSSVGRGLGGDGLSGRVDIWRTSWRIMTHHPWYEFDELSLPYLRPVIGYGPDMFKYVYLLERQPQLEDRKLVSNRFAHNFFIHNGVELGFLGLMTSIGLFVAIFLAGGYQLLRKGPSYSPLQKLVLAGVLATVAGWLLGQMVGIAAVSDLTILWALLAVFAALPTIMRAPLEAPDADSQPPSAQRFSSARSIRGSDRDRGQIVWRLAAVACLIFGVGVLTWEKSASYPLAAVVGRQGLEQLQNGELKDALSSLNRAVELAPDVTLYHNLRSAVYSAYRVDDGPARESECAVLGAAQTYDDCLAWKAYLSVRSGSEQRPFDWRSRHSLAESTLAVSLLKQDAGLAGEATRLYQEAAELDPEDWWKWARLAAAYLQMGQPEAALSPLGKSLAILPGEQGTAQTLVLRGMAFQELNQISDAIRDFDQAILLNPNMTDAYVNRGASFNDLGQYQRAIEDFDKAIELNQTIASAYINRGNSYGNLDRPERALTDFDEAIRLDSRVALAYYNRALVNVILGRDAAALQDANRAEELGFNPTALAQAMQALKEAR